MNMNRIVVNGQANVLKDPGNQQKIDDAVGEIRARYDQEMKTAGAITRIRLRFTMWQEMRRAAERLAPSRGCYFRR